MKEAGNPVYAPPVFQEAETRLDSRTILCFESVDFVNFSSIDLVTQFSRKDDKFATNIQISRRDAKFAKNKSLHVLFYNDVLAVFAHLRESSSSSL